MRDNLSTADASRPAERGAASGDYKIWQVITASAVGTMIEWYDFYIFGSLAAVISPLFYPPGNDTFAYIAYLATFAVLLLRETKNVLIWDEIESTPKAGGQPS
jgi:hypothetical protein